MQRLHSPYTASRHPSCTRMLDEVAHQTTFHSLIYTRFCCIPGNQQATQALTALPPSSHPLVAANKKGNILVAKWAAAR